MMVINAFAIILLFVATSAVTITALHYLVLPAIQDSVRATSWTLPEVFTQYRDLTGLSEAECKVEAEIAADRKWVLHHLALVDYCPVGYTLSTSQDGTRTLAPISTPYKRTTDAEVLGRFRALTSTQATPSRARPFGGSLVTHDEWELARLESLRYIRTTSAAVDRTVKALRMGYVSKDDLQQELSRNVCDDCGDPYDDHSPACGLMAPPTRTVAQEMDESLEYGPHEGPYPRRRPSRTFRSCP